MEERKIDTVLFDLDGTLLPMDTDTFIKVYFDSLGKYFGQRGYCYQTILNGVIAGTKAMLNQDGTHTNEVVFWNQFEKTTKLIKKEVFEDFTVYYADVFPTLHKSTSQNKAMIDSVHLLKKKGYRLLLATNPMFPIEAVIERIKWTGLSADLFDVITSYETSCAIKPNVLYYQEVINSAKLDVNTCMMVGNDVQEDGVVESLGIPLYLIEDYMIHREDEPIDCTWYSRSEQFYEFVEKMDTIQKK